LDISGKFSFIFVNPLLFRFSTLFFAAIFFLLIWTCSITFLFSFALDYFFSKRCLG
jgi:hypothetical protein